MELWIGFGLLFSVVAIAVLTKRLRKLNQNKRIDRALSFERAKQKAPPVPHLDLMSNEDEDKGQDSAVDVADLRPSTKPATIIAVSVMAQQGNFGRFQVEPGFLGRTLLLAFKNLQLGFGDLNVFHRQSAFGAPAFSVANVSEPGDFDLDQMPSTYYAGLLFFMKLPQVSSTPPLEAFDSMLATATRLSTSLGGVLCDQQGRPLSRHVIERLRELVASMGEPEELMGMHVNG